MELEPALLAARARGDAAAAGEAESRIGSTLRTALQRHPEDAECRARLARLLRFAGRDQDATTVLGSAPVPAASLALERLALATTLAAETRLDAALDALTVRVACTALRGDPDFRPSFLADLSGIASTAPDASRAALAKEAGDHPLARAWTAAADGHWDAVEGAALQASKDPAFCQEGFALAVVAMQAGARWPEAARAARAASASAPSAKFLRRISGRATAAAALAAWAEGSPPTAGTEPAESEAKDDARVVTVRAILARIKALQDVSQWESIQKQPAVAVADTLTAVLEALGALAFRAKGKRLEELHDAVALCAGQDAKRLSACLACYRAELELRYGRVPSGFFPPASLPSGTESGGDDVHIEGLIQVLKAEAAFEVGEASLEAGRTATVWFEEQRKSRPKDLELSRQRQRLKCSWSEQLTDEELVLRVIGDKEEPFVPVAATGGADALLRARLLERIGRAMSGDARCGYGGISHSAGRSFQAAIAAADEAFKSQVAMGRISLVKGRALLGLARELVREEKSPEGNFGEAQRVLKICTGALAGSPASRRALALAEMWSAIERNHGPEFDRARQDYAEAMKTTPRHRAAYLSLSEACMARAIGSGDLAVLERYQSDALEALRKTTQDDKAGARARFLLLAWEIEGDLQRYRLGVRDPGGMEAHRQRLSEEAKKAEHPVEGTRAEIDRLALRVGLSRFQMLPDAQRKAHEKDADRLMLSAAGLQARWPGDLRLKLLHAEAVLEFSLAMSDGSAASRGQAADKAKGVAEEVAKANKRLEREANWLRARAEAVRKSPKNGK